MLKYINNDPNPSRRELIRAIHQLLRLFTNKTCAHSFTSAQGFSNILLL